MLGVRGRGAEPARTLKNRTERGKGNGGEVCKMCGMVMNSLDEIGDGGA